MIAFSIPSVNGAVIYAILREGCVSNMGVADGPPTRISGIVWGNCLMASIAIFECDV